MKAEELRIGNYIIYQKEHIIKCDLKDIELSEIDREPIPLTKEILLKCGYVKQERNKYRVVGHCIWNVQEDMFVCDKNGVILKYLHQLQNLYFALTGEGLNVKL